MADHLTLEIETPLTYGAGVGDTLMHRLNVLNELSLAAKPRWTLIATV